MNAKSVMPAASVSLVPAPAPFSLERYRAFNDTLEAKYPTVAAERTAKRIADAHREAREYLRRVRRGDRSALEGAVESLLAVSELRSAR